MVTLLQYKLLMAQQRQKDQADKNRIEREFTIGDSIFVKLKPYIQSSVTTRVCQKLSFSYFGPYTIVQRIRAVSYKLQSPETSMIHLVTHVYQLKKAMGNEHKVSKELPSLFNPFEVPKMVLQRRTIHVNNGWREQVLIK